MRSLVVALVILAAAAAVPRAEPNVQPTRDQTLTRFFAPTTPPLVSYRAHRKLNAATRGGKMTASLEAVTALDPNAGFSYQVLSEEGSSIILHHVLHPALDAEQKAEELNNRLQDEVHRLQIEKEKLARVRKFLESVQSQIEKQAGTENKSK